MSKINQTQNIFKLPDCDDGGMVNDVLLDAMGKQLNPCVGVQLSGAWSSFSQILAVVLAKLDEDDDLCLSMKSSDSYILFSANGKFGIRVETSNHMVSEENEHFNIEQINLLIAAGWNAPNWTPDASKSDDDFDGCSYHFIDISHPVAYETIANLVVHTFAEILRVPNPNQLAYSAYHADYSGPQ